MEIILTTFSSYLKTTGASPSTGKNYVSDLRSFLVWLISRLSEQGLTFRTSSYELLSYVNAEIIANYIDSLEKNGAKDPTVSRKIASFKKFFDFAANQGWIPHHILKSITYPKAFSEKRIDSKKVLDEFEEFLRRDGMSLFSRKNYLGDVKQFLTWNSQTR